MSWLLDHWKLDHWKAEHRVLGCRGCRFADRTKIGIGPCCTATTAIRVDRNGRCLTRKARAKKGKKGGAK